MVELFYKSGSVRLTTPFLITGFSVQCVVLVVALWIPSVRCFCVSILWS